MAAAPLKILVIDDEPQIRKLLRMGLSMQGYEVIEAVDGKTAIDPLAKKPDVILLDLGLPGVEGHELLRTMRSRAENTPIVELSVRDDEVSKVEAPLGLEDTECTDDVKWITKSDAVVRGTSKQAAQ